MEGVFPTRDEEIANLQKAIDLKKDAGAETGKANALHEEHNKYYEAGDKEVARGKLADSKAHREKAKEIHEQSFDLAYKGAMSMALKALYSTYPSVDYHVFLVDPYQQSFLVVIDMMKKYGQFGRKDFLVIPGEGQHSDASKGPSIRPHFEKWMADNNIGNEKITSGSFSIILADVQPL
jgi:ATP adenylyltransferase/5',5'''-P-1,P-4-tetraphosphate phosphorylase II